MMSEPRFHMEGWLDDNTDLGLKLKDNAPEWAKEEFEDFMKQMNREPDENGIVILC